MTEKIRRAAERAAAPGTRIVAVNPPVGPESIGLGGYAPPLPKRR